MRSGLSITFVRRATGPPIVNHYIAEYSTRFGKTGITFMPQTIDTLMVCDWEGNVRQLCNEIQARHSPSG